MFWKSGVVTSLSRESCFDLPHEAVKRELVSEGLGRV